MTFKTYNKEQVEQLIEKQPEGKNTRFLNSAHSLWFRFHNYDNHPPYVLEDNDEAVALIFATQSKRSRYVNLYEIVTLEGKEGKGYASKVWSHFIKEAHGNGMERLKMSCTPTSVTWHMRNGLVFWAVDPSGSLRSDQPLYPTREGQQAFRIAALDRPELAFPPQKVIDKLVDEGIDDHGFGKKKYAVVEQAIKDVGNYWLRDSLLINQASLEEFFA